MVATYDVMMTISVVTPQGERTKPFTWEGKIVGEIPKDKGLGALRRMTFNRCQEEWRGCYQNWRTGLRFVIDCYNYEAVPCLKMSFETNV